MRRIDENLVSAIVSVIDNAAHPSIKFSEIALIRQALIMSQKVEDADSTDTANIKATI